jgi:hypothetical protein
MIRGSEGQGQEISWGVEQLQQYKFYRWQDNLGDALMESAFLSFMLSLSAILGTSEKASNNYKYSLISLVILIWTLDFVIRVKLQIEWLQDRRNDRKGKEEKCGKR